MQLGGPVWHVSVAPLVVDDIAFTGTETMCWAYAVDALEGVGNASLGEWRERGDLAVHLRRRLSARERRDAGSLTVVDVRGTDEHTRRIDRMKPFLPPVMRRMTALEYP